MGTIPDCTGLDHDDLIDPGAEIEIGIERLGSLRCRFAAASRSVPQAKAVAATGQLDLDQAFQALVPGFAEFR